MTTNGANPTVALTTTPALRKKGPGTRTWLSLDSTGQTQSMEAGKYMIMRRTGLPARDLRVLDPLLSYPSTVFGRERAIVVNLEHVKAIILAKEVLLLNSKDPFVMPFVLELQRRVLYHHEATTKVQEATVHNDPTHREGQSEIVVDGSHRNSGWNGSPSDGLQLLERNNLEGSKRSLKIIQTDRSKVLLPFEFVALEACLEAACTSLDNEAKSLEQEAYPALDKLTYQISTLNLERVRQIKSRLVAITGRVQKVRDELEHLLDDDGDMAEMYLTEKLVQRHFETSSTSSADGSDDVEGDGHEAMNDRDGDIKTKESNNNEEVLYSAHHNALYEWKDINEESRRSHAQSVTNVGELEMLLEAYFVQIDGTLNTLSALREYVDNTEDCINIMLDDKQNQLLQMGVMLTTATLVLTVFIVITGILGMNIRIAIFKVDVSTGMPVWLETTFGGIGGMIVLYIIAIAWYKHKRYID